MLFNSLTFVVFLIPLLVLMRLPVGWGAKKAVLLVASYVFYAAWNPPLVTLLIFSTVLDWVIGRQLAVTQGRGARRALLGASIVVNLGLLAFFKYGGFVLQNFVAAAQAYGFEFNPAKPSIILPVGISFYTFQTMTYSFDIYRGTLRPTRSFLDFALYVTFFPQLVAGPIVRASEFLPQCAEAPRVGPHQFLWGMCLLTLGLFQKVVLADTLLAPAADTVFGASGPLAPLDAWAGLLAFSSQIFCDFAGYSTCAIGVALALGFHLPNNFRFPYAAFGFSDFWRRWHITLSTWLRDYLYIPLGGNRHGALRTGLNLMVTMLLGGLWHGASWTFVAWGALHGAFLVVERLLRAAFGEARFWRTWAGEVLLVAVTYFLVCLAWVFFRSPDFLVAFGMFHALFGLSGEGTMVLPMVQVLQSFGVAAGLLVAHWLLRHSSHEALVRRTPWWMVSVVWAAMAAAVIFAQGGGHAFIYFQF